MFDNSGVTVLRNLVEKFASLGTRSFNRQRECQAGVRLTAMGRPFGKVTRSISHVVTPGEITAQTEPQVN
jgi:hypothetical protein